MIKLTAVSILTLFFLHSSPALALEYTVLRDQNKPASSKVLASTTKSLEDTGLVSLDVDGFGEVPIEWVDQIWASPNMDQAIFIKFDLKPKDETLLGKTIKMKTALLIHGQQASGSYFAVYFSGFDEKSAKNYYQKILNTKLQPNQGAWNTLFMIPSAYAEQTNSCGTKTTGMFKGLYSVVKEYRWTCLKSFVKVAFGSIIGAVAGTVLGVLDGTIWTKVGTNWSFITSVISAISKTTGALKDLDYLPLKDRAQFICEALGKGVNSASGSFSGVRVPLLSKKQFHVLSNK